MAHLELVSSNLPSASPQVTPEESAAMQRAIVKLFALWSLSDEQACILLGGLSPRTYARWKTGTPGRASVDMQARMSNLLGIHKALRLLFEQPERAYAWIKRPSDDLDGISALDLMLGGQLTDLMRVRRYLDSQRSPW